MLVADALPPMLGFGMMLLVLHVAIPYWGIAIAYTIALLLTLSWSGALVLLRPRGSARRSPTAIIKHSAALHRLRGAVERGRDRLS